MARLGMVFVSAMAIVFLASTQLYTSLHPITATSLTLRDLQSIPEQQQQQQYRLEYIHIPKTSGTMLEELAGTHNVTWGACHFQSFVHQSRKSQEWMTYPPWPSCPPPPPSLQNIKWPSNITNPWHLPLHLLPHYISFDPYDDIQQEQQQEIRPKRFFTVVRNPYDRILSLYYYTKGWNVTLEEMNDPKRLQDYILNHVQNEACHQAHACLHHDESCHGMFAGARQYDYIYHGKHKMIPHVLHLESLQQEFAQLSHDYQLGFFMSTKPPPMQKRRILTAANLTQQALFFINRHFKEDFKLGRGYEMQPVTDFQLMHVE